MAALPPEPPPAAAGAGDDTAAAALPRISPGERVVVEIARALVGDPRARGELPELLGTPRLLGPRIGPACAALVEDALRRAWLAAWRLGGAAPRDALAPAPGGGAAIARGRPWERHAPPPLAFTGASLALLRWLAAAPLEAPLSTIEPLAAPPAAAPGAALAPGDELLVFLALDATEGTPPARAIAAQPLARAAALAHLGFAPLLAAASSPSSPSASGAPAAPAAPAPDFARLTTGAGAILVEALAAPIARRWAAAELAKRAATDPHHLLATGAAQSRALDAFLAACDAARRRDLAGFVIDAAAPLLARGVAPIPLDLDPATKLATRADARRAAGALLRAVARWAAWDQEHRGVRFIDDDYAAAQLLLRRFEPIGAAGAARAERWLAELASLVPAAGASDTVVPP